MSIPHLRHRPRTGQWWVLAARWITQGKVRDAWLGPYKDADHALSEHAAIIIPEEQRRAALPSEQVALKWTGDPPPP